MDYLNEYGDGNIERKTNIARGRVDLSCVRVCDNMCMFVFMYIHVCMDVIDLWLELLISLGVCVGVFLTTTNKEWYELTQVGRLCEIHRRPINLAAWEP